MLIQTHAWKIGWRTSCQGLTSRGVWSKQRRSLHINVLELLAVKLALLSFTKNKKVRAIHVQIDNATGLRYLTKMRGVKSLEMIKLRKEIWDYRLSRGMTITTEYLPNKLNIISDPESGEKVDYSEWKFNPRVFQGLVQLMGNPVVDLFASQQNHQLPQYIAWRPDLFSQGTDAIHHDWFQDYLFAFSSFLPYRWNFTEGKVRKNAKHVFHNTNIAHSTLLSIPLSNISRNISYLPKDKEHSQWSFRERSSLHHQQNSKVSGMKTLRGRLSLSGVLGTASRLIANPRRSSSTGNYESTWGKWVGWCRRRQIDPVLCDITPILDFLGELFDAGYEYRRINSHRSAISTYHQPIDGKGLGSNDRVCKLLSWVFNLHPPQPKYTFIWDVQTILEYIKVNWSGWQCAFG